jgi:hypothetical protein
LIFQNVAISLLKITNTHMTATQNITIETKTINVGYWLKIQVVSVNYGFSQILKDGKWVNVTSKPERFEEEILTFGKCFENHEDAEKFMKTKQFKSLLKNIEKNWR